MNKATTLLGFLFAIGCGDDVATSYDGSESESESESEGEPSEGEAEAESESESEGEDACGTCPAEWFCRELDGKCLPPLCEDGEDCSETGCGCGQVGCIGGECDAENGECVFVDNDGDWYSPSTAAFDCELDCDDTDRNIHPDATEVCNGLDDNCDGIIDEGTMCAACAGGPIMLYYRDADGDGYGDESNSQYLCSGVGATGWVDIAGDCDDTREFTYPEAPESCNGIDDDCDPGTTDGSSEYYPACYPGGVAGCDFRDDPWCVGECRTGFEACRDGGIVCEDAVTPIPEVCGNGLDDNCDGEIDEGCEVEACTTVNTGPDFEATPVSGAPRFSVAFGSPVMVVPGSRVEVARFVGQAECECSDTMIRGTEFWVGFSDNAGSGWRPGVMQVRDLATGTVIMGPQVAAYEDGEASIYEFPEDYALLACEPRALSVELNLTDDGRYPSAVLDDALQVMLNVVQFTTMDDGMTYTTEPRVAANTLVF